MSERASTRGMVCLHSKFGKNRAFQTNDFSLSLFIRLRIGNQKGRFFLIVLISNLLFIRSRAFLFLFWSGKYQKRIKLWISCIEGPCQPCSSLLPRPPRAQNATGTQAGLEVVVVVSVFTALNCRVEFLKERARSLYLADAIPRKHRASSMLPSVLGRQALEGCWGEGEGWNKRPRALITDERKLPLQPAAQRVSAPDLRGGLRLSGEKLPEQRRDGRMAARGRPLNHLSQSST